MPILKLDFNWRKFETHETVYKQRKQQQKTLILDNTKRVQTVHRQANIIPDTPGIPQTVIG